MLKKKNRMGRNKEFDRAFKVGQSFYGKILGVKAVDNSLAFSRLGVLISTKVSKKAVIRNHFKRQIREVVRAELPSLKSGKDLVIIVFPQILDKKFEEIQIFLKTGFKRLNLYK
jgi:ribonuclease P protein component